MKLEIEHVKKQYKDGTTALSEVCLEAKPGIIGLLGENGAGKSTLMRIIATISSPTSGRVVWNGSDIGKKPEELRRVLGYLPQDFGVYPQLNAVEFLEYLAAVKGVQGRGSRGRIEELLRMVHLYEVRKRALKGYSGGMRQRLGIAQALLNDPKLLIVDEPTVGLDPTERVRFRNLLTDLAGERIVLFSTHIVSDLEATAGRIALLSKGRLLFDASPEQLVKLVLGKVWEVTIPADQLPELRRYGIISGTIRTESGVRVRLVAEDRPAEKAVPVSPGLEDAYLYRISQPLKDDRGAAL